MTTTVTDRDVSDSLDKSSLSIFHLKAAVTAGAGFFTDSFDLNVIGTVVFLVKPQLHLDSAMVSALSSSSLLAVAIGAMAFGRLGDLLGRRRIYGLEAILMIIGALVSAFAPNFTVLIIGRLILGIGIGGDYPASAVLTAEYANQRSRGRLVGTAFIFYVFGQVMAYVASLLILAVGTPNHIAWRIALGLGALPSILVLYQRRHMPESPRWTAEQGDASRAMSDLEEFARRNGQFADAPITRTTRKRTIAWRRLLPTLLGTGGCWFFFNIATYGNNVSQPMLIKNISPGASTITNIGINALLVIAFSLTGAIVGLAVLDRMGRRTQQAVGFAMMAVSMGLIAIVPRVSGTVVPFGIVYGLLLFGVAFGPNYTTMLLAAEAYPTQVRSTFHGMSAGAGKLGGFLGALVVPLILAGPGLRTVAAVLTVTSVAALLATFLIPEPKGEALDRCSQRLLADAADEHPLPLAA